MSLVNSPLPRWPLPPYSQLPLLRVNQGTRLAGSSTVLPYASIRCEAVGENFRFSTPVVESVAPRRVSSVFVKAWGETPNRRRQKTPRARSKDSEIEVCAANGCDRTSSKFRSAMTGSVSLLTLTGNTVRIHPRDWLQALSAEVVVDGSIVANPNKMWSTSNPSFPDQPIQAYIPGTKLARAKFSKKK